MARPNTSHIVGREFKNKLTLNNKHKHITNQDLKKPVIVSEFSKIDFIGG